jgi:hypothetical protein
VRFFALYILSLEVLAGTFSPMMHLIQNVILFHKPKLKGNAMNDGSPSNKARLTGTVAMLSNGFLGLFLAFGSTASVHAQGQIASGTVSGSGSGPYTFDLSFSDAGSATSPIGSVWYGWVPGSFFLPGAPTGASAPSGWTASIISSSIQFVASSPANYIQPGQQLSGFSFQATFSPATLAATANSGESVAYSAGIGSDTGNTFTVQPSSVPEPSSLALVIPGAIGWLMVRRRKSVV